MLGKPHNIVRHPDVPKAAFEDMWRDLKAGRPWRGVVKNRRRDGGYYWVVANVSPVREGGRIVGYQSVRTRPSRTDVAAAEAAYREVNAGRLGVLHGAIVGNRSAPRTWLGAFNVQAALLSLMALASCGALLLNVSSWWARGALASVAAFALWFLFFTVPGLMRDMRKLSSNLEDVLVSGDFTRYAALSREDELGAISHQLGTLSSSIQATMRCIENSVREVDLATHAVAASVHEINDAAAEQSQAAMSAASAIEEVTTAIGGVVEHAREAREVTHRSGEAAREGAVQSTSASKTVTELAETVKASSEQMAELDRRSSEIGRITQVIREIADQTNLLALNAAIEAARAGDQGRGFAVVADEVRKLAERTAAATSEISAMTDGIHTESELAAQSMHRGAEQVEASVALVAAAKAALDGINKEMESTAVMVSEISLATEEQGRAMEDISGNVSHIAEMAERNRGVAAQSEALAGKLNGAMDRMNKAVGQYVV
jgi:aerotaxis receptor